MGKAGTLHPENLEVRARTSLDEAEARTWRLQEKVRELERDRERGRRRFKQLQSSKTWKLLDRISSIRARIVGR